MRRPTADDLAEARQDTDAEVLREGFIERSIAAERAIADALIEDWAKKYADLRELVVEDLRAE